SGESWIRTSLRVANTLTSSSTSARGCNSILTTYSWAASTTSDVEAGKKPSFVTPICTVPVVTAVATPSFPVRKDCSLILTSAFSTGVDSEETSTRTDVCWASALPPQKANIPRMMIRTQTKRSLNQDYTGSALLP